MDHRPPTDAERRRLEHRQALRRARVRRRRATAVGVLAAVLVLGAWVAQGGSGSGSGGATAAAAGTSGALATTPTATVSRRPVAAVPRTPPAGPPISIGWVGDIVLGSAYGMPPDGGRSTFSGVRAALARPDLMVGNLEQTLSVGGASKCGAGSSSCFAFQAPPSMARVLRDAGFDVMNVANNHASDYGSGGIAQTLAALRKNGLAWSGRPGQIIVRTVDGVRVAFVGFASYPWASRIEQIPSAAALVRKARRRATSWS